MDFSKPEIRELYESEVRKRMKHPFLLSREQAEMLVAVLMFVPQEEIKDDDDRS